MEPFNNKGRATGSGTTSSKRKERRKAFQWSFLEKDGPTSKSCLEKHYAALEEARKKCLDKMQQAEVEEALEKADKAHKKALKKAKTAKKAASLEKEATPKAGKTLEKVKGAKALEKVKAKPAQKAMPRHPGLPKSAARSSGTKGPDPNPLEKEEGSEEESEEESGEADDPMEVDDTSSCDSDQEALEKVISDKGKNGPRSNAKLVTAKQVAREAELKEKLQEALKKAKAEALEKGKGNQKDGCHACCPAAGHCLGKGKACLGKGGREVPHLCGLAQHLGKGRGCVSRQHGSFGCLVASLQSTHHLSCRQPVEAWSSPQGHWEASTGWAAGQLPCHLAEVGATWKSGLVLPLGRHSDLRWSPQDLQGGQGVGLGGLPSER